MSLNPKPFSPAEKIRNRNYLPAPGRITSVDINQEKEALVSSMEFHNDITGAYSAGFGVNVNSLALVKTLGPLTYTLNYDIEFFSDSSPKIFAKTVEFRPWDPAAVPDPQFIGTVTGSSPPTLSIWLVAEKNTITFSDDAIMSGVNGPGFPGPLSSSDTIVWRNESVVLVSGSGLPSVSGAFEVICKIGSVVYKDERYLNIPNDYTPIFIPEVVDSNQVGNTLLDLNGQLANVMRGSKARNISEAIQRLALLTDDIYSRFPRLKSFSDVVYISTTTSLNASNIRNLVQFSGQSAIINVTTPISTDVLDLDSISFQNGGAFPVKLIAGSGTTIMGVSEYWLYQKGTAVELVYDENTTNWSVSSLNSIKKYQDVTLNNTASITIASVDLNKVLYSTGSSPTIAVTLPAGINVESGDFIKIINSSLTTSVLTISEAIGDSIDFGAGIPTLRFKDWVTLVAKRIGSNVVWVPTDCKFSSAAVTPIPNPVYVAFNGGGGGGSLGPSFAHFLKHPNIIFNGDSAYNASTGRYTAPKTGYYRFHATGSSSISASTLTDVGFLAYVNGVNQGYLTSENDTVIGYTGGGVPFKYAGECFLFMTAGDYFQASVETGTSETITHGTHYLRVEYLPQP